MDSSDEARMEESGEELSNLLAEEKLAGIPLLVYANKQDLDLAEPEDVVSDLSLAAQPFPEESGGAATCQTE